MLPLDALSGPPTGAPPGMKQGQLPPQEAKAMIRSGLMQMRKMAEAHGLDFDSLVAESSRAGGEGRAPIPPVPMPMPPR